MKAKILKYTDAIYQVFYLLPFTFNHRLNLCALTFDEKALVGPYYHL